MDTRLLVVACLGLSCTGLVGDPVSTRFVGRPSNRGDPPPTQPAPDGGIAASCSSPQPGRSPLRLLTRSEYNNTIRDLLGDTSQPAQAFPPENVALGFDNNAETHLTSPLLVERYQDAAEAIAHRVVSERFDQTVPCPDGSAIACLDTFIDAFGRRAFRRPLIPEEHQVFIDLYIRGLMEADHRTAVRWVLQAFLQSPQFLYRADLLEENEPPVVPVTGYELASRLSYFLWNSTPDDALLDAASRGELVTREQIEATSRRMFADRKARDATADFHRQWLGLDSLAAAPKDFALAGLSEPPGGLAALADSWQRSLYAFLDHAIFESADPIGELFNSRVVYLDRVSGPLYGAANLEGLTPVTLPADERGGLLTQPALLAKLAYPNQTSPIHRGLFVREKLLCETLPPPPPNVMAVPPDPDPRATTRERFAQHTAQELCRGCHQLIDPIGFGFEGYDQFGRFRAAENGHPIDSSGVVIASEEAELNGPFSGALDLAHRLAGSHLVRECLARQWYRYAMGRGEAAPADSCALAEAERAFEARGDLRELMVALTLTETFRLRSGAVLTPPEPLPPDPDAGALDAQPVEPPDGGMAMTGPPAAPIGNVEGIDLDGVVVGWALDPNTPAYPLMVEFFLDGEPSTATLIGSVRATEPRPDVNLMTGQPGDHGFSFRLPPNRIDGQLHHLVVLTTDTGNGESLSLPGSPLDYSLSLTSPIGALDSVLGGVALGWASDLDSAPAPIAVSFYVDGPAGSGMSIGAANTGLPRPDINLYPGYPGDLGFRFELPATLRDGRPHRLYAYGMDSAGGHDAPLGNSPTPFTWSP